VTLEQVILWEFNTTDYDGWGLTKRRNNDYVVIDWARTADTTPIHRQGNRWVGKFKGRWISARIFIETWTTIDPELEDRVTFPEKLRRGLK
jgi:hypothetical protein